jgi:hypothetical protein
LNNKNFKNILTKINLFYLKINPTLLNSTYNLIKNSLISKGDKSLFNNFNYNVSDISNLGEGNFEYFDDFFYENDNTYIFNDFLDDYLTNIDLVLNNNIVKKLKTL